MDVVETKQCTHCEEIFPLVNFHKNSGMASGYLNQCKNCTNAKSKQWKSDNRGSSTVYDQKAREKHSTVRELMSDQAYKAAFGEDITCTVCDKTKSFTEFKKDSRKKSGRASICKVCASAYSHKRYHNQPPVYDAAKRRAKIVAAYGLTLDDYDTIYQEQDGKCKICSIEEKYAAKGRFHIDHCHDTGVVRGLLCSHCNKGLGMFRHNQEFLSAAVNYLAEFNDEE